MKKSLIIGITGRDGSYLTELPIEEGFEVHGIVRRVAVEHPQARRIWHVRFIEDPVQS